MSAAKTLANWLRDPLLILLFAIASFAAWRGEVEWIKGWNSLAWIESFQWSALIVSVFVPLSILASYGSVWKHSAVRTLLFIMAVWAISLTAYLMGFHALNGWASPGAFDEFFRILYKDLFAAVLFASVGIFLAIRLLLARIGVRSLLFLIAALALIPAASYLTIAYFPAHDYTDPVHVVKSGYPVFWVNVLSGGVGWVEGARRG